MKRLTAILASIFLALSVVAGPVHTEIFWKKKPKQAPTPSPSEGEVIMYHTIEKELSPFIEEKCKFTTVDALYGCLPEATVRMMVKNLLFTFDNAYIDETRDCDDHAWEFLVKFRRFHRDITQDVPLAASAGFIGAKLVGDIPEMGYLLDGNIGYHAIVVIRCQGGKWLLVDPGTKRVSELTQHLYEGTIELRLAIF